MVCYRLSNNMLLTELKFEFMKVILQKVGPLLLQSIAKV